MGRNQRNICDPIMLGLFREELAGQVYILESGLAEIEQGLPPEQIDSLLHAVHAIKGAARVVGLPVAVSLAYAMEKFLSEVRLENCRLFPPHIDQLRQATEIFHGMRDQEEKDIPRWVSGREPFILGITQDLWKALDGLEAFPFTEDPEAAITKETSEQVETGGDVSAAEVPEDIPAPGAMTDAASPFPENTAEVISEGETPEWSNMAPEAPEANASAVISERIEVPADDDPVPEPPAEIPREIVLYPDNMIALAGECLIQARRIRDLHPALCALWQRAPAAGTPPLTMTGASPGSRPAVNQGKTAVAGPVLMFDRSTQRLEHLAGQLYDKILVNRTVPFADLIRNYPRRISDLEGKLGKAVKFLAEGKETLIDRSILAKLEAPLWQLIRCALFCSVETPSARQAAGKLPEGVLSLAISSKAGMLHLLFTDDGRGINQEDLKAVAGEPENAEESEKDSVFDTLRATMQSLNGTMDWKMLPGEGTHVHLVLPAISSVLNCLLVRIGGEDYALPMMGIDRVVKIAAESRQGNEGRPSALIDGDIIELIDARQIFKLLALPSSAGDLPVVVLHKGPSRYGLVVEALRGEENLVLRPLDERLGKVPYIRAAAILGDGSPTLLLDMDDLLSAMELMAGPGRLSQTVSPAMAASLTQQRDLSGEDDPGPFWRW